jgi:hypothetical protein
MKIVTWFQNFLATHKISAHSVIAVVLIVVTAYYQVQQFHDYVVHVYGLLPNGVRNFTAAAIAVIGWYWKTQRTS